MADAAARRAHEEANARGADMYRDPSTGYWVMTAGYLRRRGYCCGRCCRHCPYTEEERLQAGRPTAR